MDAKDAQAFVAGHLSYDAGRFYSPATSFSLGAGQLYAGIRYPLYEEQQHIFVTAQGSAYVLTHECDIDQANERTFNTELLVCPILDFGIFVQEYQNEFKEPEFISFLSSLSKHRINRLLYLPPFSPEHIPYGGLLYFNEITHTHISAFTRDRAALIGTVTAYGLEVVDRMLQNHLFRPKVERLPFAPA